MRPLGAEADSLAFAPGDAGGLADALQALFERPPAASRPARPPPRAIVRADHEVDGLMARLVEEMGG